MSKMKTIAAAVAALLMSVSLSSVAHAQNQYEDGLAGQQAADGSSQAVDDLSTDRLFILVNKAQRGTSPTAQTMNVYLDGQLLYTWPVSTGRERPEIAKSGRQYFSATPIGTFRFKERIRHYVSGTWQAPMPFAQFLIGGIAIHATVPAHYAALGSRDSGGCVRLRYDNAETIWNLVDQVGPQNVKIQIVDSEQ